ncbi:MAG: hypothetical protein ACREUU_20745 [Gammaproteobacteria bacterium]
MKTKAHSSATMAEYARHAGVDRSTVTRWRQKGSLVQTPDGLVDVVASDALRAKLASDF